MNKKRQHFLIVLAIISLGFLFQAPGALAEDFGKYNNVKCYDRHFKKYSKRFFGPGFDWLHFKSQAVAESRLKKDASSGVGARGLMQIMPGTYEEIRKRNPEVKGPVDDPRWNIAAGIGYDRSIWLKWRSERPFQDRVDFMMGSYNAGFGNILKAQRLAESGKNNANLWRSIEKYLPKVTRAHSNETISYVRNIKKIKGELR